MGSAEASVIRAAQVIAPSSAVIHFAQVMCRTLSRSITREQCYITKQGITAK
jgi:hypothetical protein